MLCSAHTNNTIKNESNIFLSTINHSSVGGYSCLAKKKHGSYSQEFKKTKDLKNCLFTAQQYEDSYVSINTFKKKNRGLNNLYNLSSFYVDLDCHKQNCSKEQIMTIYNKLMDAYDHNLLSKPTMVTFTGRGLGIFYVLNKSINCNIENTKKMRFLFNETYKQLLKNYEQFLSDDHIEVDQNVLDGSRIVRVPGTMNSNNNEICHLLFVNKNNDGSICYINNFNEVSIIKEGHQKNSKNKNAKESQLILFSKASTKYMLNQRVSKLLDLVEMRKNSDCPYRELTIHFIYNFAIQSGYSPEKAYHLIYAANNKYKSPLSERELQSAMGSVSGEHNYFYRDQQIISKLKITKEENEILKFGLEFNRTIERAKQTYSNKIKKAERDYSIACYIKNNPETKITDVAKMFNVGRTTVNNVIKEYGVNKNVCKNENKGNILDIYAQKVQKFDTILWCVVNNDNSEAESAQNSTISDKQSSQDTYKNDSISIKEPIPFDSSYLNCILFNKSFLNYLINHSSSGYKRAFQLFLSTYEDYLVRSSSSNMKRMIVKSINFIGHSFENEMILEQSITPLNYLFSIMKSNKSLKGNNLIPLNLKVLKSFTIDQALSTFNINTDFEYHPVFDHSAPNIILTAESKNKTILFHDYLNQKYMLLLADLKETVIPNLYKELTNKSLDLDLFDTWKNSSREESSIKGLHLIEKHLSVSNKPHILKTLSFIVEQNLISLDGDQAYSKLLEFFDIKDISSLSTQIKPRSLAQKKAAALYHMQDEKWDYIKAHSSNTTKAFSKIYKDFKRMIQNDLTSFSFNGIDYDLNEFKKKYLYVISKNDLISIEHKYKDHIDLQTLLSEIIDLKKSKENL